MIVWMCLVPPKCPHRLPASKHYHVFRILVRLAPPFQSQERWYTQHWAASLMSSILFFIYSCSFVIFFCIFAGHLWLKWHSIFYAMRKLKNHRIKKSICFNLQNRLLWLLSGEFCMFYFWKATKIKKESWNLVSLHHSLVESKGHQTDSIYFFSFLRSFAGWFDRMKSE